MDEGWQHNGLCTIRIFLTWRESTPSRRLGHHKVTREWHVTVRIVLRGKECFADNDLYPYISYNTTMEMEQLSRSPDIPSEQSSVKSFSDHNDIDDGIVIKRKASSSPDMDIGSQGPVEKKLKLFSGNDNGSRAAYSRDDRFIYGNPKEVIKPSTPLENFDSNSVLDLSCKSARTEEEKPKSSEGTYQHSPRNNHPYLPDAFPRSNLEIKLVNAPKRPSTAEQLEIAKIQQQQRRSVQQQQKLLQQMRRSLDAGASRGHPPTDPHKKPASREEPPDTPKSDFRSLLTPPFPPHPYFDPTQTKELPDSHPILPLLDPVYFSALYNAHGFLPPSSPSIAAAFIGTLQDALPKLSMMFPPSTSSCSSPLLPQKGSENPN